MDNPRSILQINLSPRKLISDYFTSIIAIILLILIIIIALLSPRSQSQSLSSKLSNSGWIVYYRKGCGYCNAQKDILGSNYKMFIEYDTNGNQIGGLTTITATPEISGYPFWYNINTHATKIGLQDINSLNYMANM